MSDEYQNEPEELIEDAELLDEDSDEYEEISSDEVDRVIESLEALLSTVDSENIRFYLEDAINEIFYLVYEEEEDGVDEIPQDEAA